MAESLRIVPLGGLGEIGMNCLVLEAAGRRVMIDCGVTFDSADYGIDTFHPRFDAVLDAPDTLDALVLTHGHEDHVGAVAHLVAALAAAGRRRPLPVWGPAYGLALCRRRLEEARHLDAVEEHPLEAGERRAVGPFEIEPVHVTHSIPSATALAIFTGAGTVIHSGDFKLDTRPIDGRLTDLARLEALGDDGVALLLSDSTNVLTAGSAATEGEVADALGAHIAAARARVVVGLFASNIHRIDGVARAARAAGRKVCLLGRSVRDHVAIAQRLAVLDWPSDLVVSPELARSSARGAVLYVASGTQGEPFGAMRRIASGTHPDLRLEAGDEVILSSRVIPGNERAVLTMLDELLARGVAVKSRITHPEVHASGHAHEGELQRLLEVVRPRAFIPLHGTRLHLARHAALAESLGVADVLTLANGETARLDEGGLTQRERVVSGRVATANAQALEDEVLRERRQLGRGGVVVAAVTVGGDAPRVEVVVRGVPRPEEVEGWARAAVTALLADDGGASRRELELGERIRRSIRRRLVEELGYKPLVEVCVSR